MNKPDIINYIEVPTSTISGTTYNYKRYSIALENYIKYLESKVKNLGLFSVVGQSEQLICHHCGKYKRMQGNGIMHQLCECGEQAN